MCRSIVFDFFLPLSLLQHTQIFLVDFCFVLQVVPLASVIVKEAMTDEDVLNCQKTIYNLVDMERKNDPLPISTVGTRGKGPKRLHAYLFLLMLDFSQKYYVYIVFIPDF